MLTLKIYSNDVFNTNFVCFRYLAIGDSLKSISFSYRLGHCTVQNIVIITCKIITENLISEMLPQTSEDKKYFAIQVPWNNGSQFYNYKKAFSNVLLTPVDAHYNFVAVDVGGFGKTSDGGIFFKIWEKHFKITAYLYYSIHHCQLDIEAHSL